MTTTGFVATSTLGSPVAVQAGMLYWLTATVQGSPATNPTVAAISGVNPLILAATTGTGAATYFQTGVTAGLPTAWSGTLTPNAVGPWPRPHMTT